MTDSDAVPAGKPENRAPSTEPPSSPAPAERRGPTLWQRIKGLLALRTVSLRDDLEVALESEANGESADFSAPERAILQNVLQLSEKHIDDVMVPRADIQAISAEETLGSLVSHFRRVNHSRIPVYADSLDNITGFVHVK